MSAIRNKQRLIHLYRYLMEYTDEEHQATTNDLVEFLREEDANVSRKTVKDDIEVLVEEGIDIIVNKSFYNSYFVGSRLFEVPEIQLLVDGIASNKSISKEKKEKIIGKLLSLLSVYQAEKVEKNLHYEDHYGSLGGQLYYNIDRITDAINDNRKIGFEYCEKRAADPAGDSAEKISVVMTPVLVRNSHNIFFVCGYSEKGKQAVVYRLDGMTRTRILEEKGDPYPSQQRIDRFLNSLFGMEIGTFAEVTLECSDEISGMIRERFGESAEIWRSTQDSFYVKTLISVSPAFYSWVFRYSPSIRIVSPAEVCEEYAVKVREAAGAVTGK